MCIVYVCLVIFLSHIHGTVPVGKSLDVITALRRAMCYLLLLPSHKQTSYGLPFRFILWDDGSIGLLL